MATAANLSWNWVVEALADCEQVNPSILIDLVKSKSGISDDLGNNAREIVSLRILESLFLPGSDTTTDTGSFLDARVGFDTTQNCEDVLRHILNEQASRSKNKLEKSKWDVQPFLAQKRSSMTKSSLQQFKEAILEGRHPMLASLKERSGLTCGDKSEIRNSGVAEKEICLNPGIGVAEAREDSLNRNFLHAVLVRDKSSTEIYRQPSLGDQNILVNGCDRLSNASNPVNNLKANSVSSQMTETIEEPSGGFLQYTHTEEHNFSKEPSMNGFQGSTLPDGCDDEHASSKNLRQSCDHYSNELSPAKKLKVDSVCVHQNVNLNSVPSQETERIDYSFRGLVQHVQTELRDLSKEPKVGLEDIRLSDGGHDVGEDMLHVTQQISCNELEVRHGISAVGQGQIASAFKDGSDEKRELMSNKIQANALNGLLSSHGANTEGSLEIIDSTEINLCINCNKGGQMLVCSSNACPLVIHESCLDSTASFDANQNFYCPFCAYSRAILEFKEAKRQALLARNNLGAFLGFQDKCRQKKSSEELNGPVQNQSREENVSENDGANDGRRNVNSVRLNEDMVLAQPSVPSVKDNPPYLEKETEVTDADGSIGDKIEGKTLLQECEPPREVEEAEIACPVFHGCEPNASSFKDKELDCVSNGTNCGLTEKELERQTLLHECKPPREPEEQQSAGQFVHDCEPNTSSFISNEIGHVTNESNCCLMQDKQDGQSTGLERQSFREHGEKQIAGQSVTNSESNASPFICKEIHHESEKHPEVQIKNTVLNHQNITIPYETSTNKDIKREEDHKPSASKYSTRLRKRKPQDTYSASPSLLLRRKVIPWTKLEEATLKEGVQKFSNAKDGVFPWKKILDFGGAVFQNRNVVDLKDKWRNICKGSSKPK